MPLQVERMEVQLQKAVEPDFSDLRRGADLRLSTQIKTKQAMLTKNKWELSTRKSKHNVRILYESAEKCDTWMVGLAESHLSETELDSKQLQCN